MLIKYVRQPHEKRQRYQKENARILVSRSPASDQLIELSGERRGGGEWVKKRVGSGLVKILWPVMG